jgi:hypothetical protein
MTPTGRPPTTVMEDGLDRLERLGANDTLVYQGRAEHRTVDVAWAAERGREDVRLLQARRPVSTRATRNALW